MADTIFALSSGGLPSGIAVVRVSGPQTKAVVELLFGRVPQLRVATFGAIHNRAGAVLDHGMVLYFESPRSFTGEDTAEFHFHGGRAVVAAALGELSAISGCRLAEAGEFTRRAFLNGKIDLIAAEAAAALIESETEAQRRFAIESGEGKQAALYAGWRGQLLEARAMIEAALDFSDEGDVAPDVAASVDATLSALVAEIGRHLACFGKAEILFRGFDVVLLGAPNAGKSSLLNAIAGREAAIVSNEPGTTRDLVSVVVDLQSKKVCFTDTAGLREKPGSVEAIGIARALERASQASLLLLLREPGGSTVEQVPSEVPALKIATKVDLPTFRKIECDFEISAQNGRGVDALMAAIDERAQAALPSAGEVLPWRQRHVDLLRGTVEGIEAVLGCVASDALELKAENLRLASDSIGALTGEISPEHMLNVIFSRFCIGK